MRQRLVGHGDVWPDRLEQLLLGHEAVRVLHEIAQHLEGLSTKLHVAIRGAQRAAGDIERISFESEHLEDRTVFAVSEMKER